MLEAAARGVLWRKVFLEISQNSQENACVRVSFFKKEILAQAFSCEFYEISKNTFLTEHLGTTASKVLVFVWIRIDFILKNNFFEQFLYYKIFTKKID